MNNQWRPVALDDYREWVSYDANGNIRSYDRNGTTTAYGTPAAGHALEMDRLSYGYTEASLNGRQVLTSNRLRHVKDAISDAGRYTEDIDNQADDNYSYDAIGNLVRDQQGGSEEIRWTVYGKIAGIHKTDGTQIYYSYDAAGNRISKTVDRSGSTNPSAGVTTTWYVRDAQGNVLSTYEKRGSSPLEQTELHLYGSSRLGIQRAYLVVEGSLVSLYTYSTETLVRGRKLYELSNHLGNVLATITDKKVLVADGGNAGGTGGVCANGGLVEVLDLYNRDGSLSSYRARQEINFYSAFESGSGDEWEGYIDVGATLCDNNGGSGTGSGMPAGSYYVADLVSGTDYAPFGMGLVGRTYNAGAYKYGFNGKERDKDIGDDSYDYGMRIHDARIGKFLSVDPLQRKYTGHTPYEYAKNIPISHIDVQGKYALFIHYILTKYTLKQAGVSDVQAQLISHYASVYADNPAGVSSTRDHFSQKSVLIILTNIYGAAHTENPIFEEVGGKISDAEATANLKYKVGINYSRTKNSQEENDDAQRWHATRTFSERNVVTKEDAVHRSLEFAWNSIFKAADDGGFEKMQENTSSIQNFSQALHTFQDIQAHNGAVFRATKKNLFGYRSKDGNEHDIDNDSHPSVTEFLGAKTMTSNAIKVFQILSGNMSKLQYDDGSVITKGMSQKQISTLTDKIKAAGYQIQSGGANTLKYHK